MCSEEKWDKGIVCACVGGVEEDSVPGVAVRESLTEIETFDQRPD